jgi:small subunit ribosomal protein S1
MSNTETMTEDFASLFAESIATQDLAEGYVAKGIVMAIEKDVAIIDVGLKVEGRVPLKEFGAKAKDGTLKVGDEVEVYVERIENALAKPCCRATRLAARKAGSVSKRSSTPTSASKASSSTRSRAASPSIWMAPWPSCRAAQVDIRPVRDVTPLMHIPQPFEILKMDKRRGNIVVSRRTVSKRAVPNSVRKSCRTSKKARPSKAWSRTSPITVRSSILAASTACCTSPTWPGARQPSVRDPVDRPDRQGPDHPHQPGHPPHLAGHEAAGKRSVGWHRKPSTRSASASPVRVTNITDYGAFVELEPGIEGLIHVSEMSWTKKNVHPGKILSTSQEVEVVVLEVDPNKRRISLGLKQTLENPWEVFAQSHPAGTEVEGEVKNKTEFGLFIGLEGDVDGMVHLSDLDWNRPGEAGHRGVQQGRHGQGRRA